MMNHTIRGRPPHENRLKRAADLASSRAGGGVLMIAGAAGEAAAGLLLIEKFLTGNGPSLEQIAALAMAAAGIYAAAHAAAAWSRHPAIPGPRAGPHALMALLDGGAAGLFLTETFFGTITGATLAVISAAPLLDIARQPTPEGAVGPPAIRVHRNLAPRRITIGRRERQAIDVRLTPRHRLDPTPEAECHLEAWLINGMDPETEQARQAWTDITGIQFTEQDCIKCGASHRHASHDGIILDDGHRTGPPAQY